jgi:hypothetical protein
MTVVLSVGSFFAIFYLFSIIPIMSTYGEFGHTYNLLQSYAILLLFMCGYILIDNGMQMANAEIRYILDKRREDIELE